MYWIRKAFERADRFLALYAMETNAIPFQLRDFMVKCWKRHRDVPTKISDLVDRAVEDLQRRQRDLKERMSKNILKSEPLDKVEDLLDCCFLVGENMPDDGDVDNERVRQKIKDIKQTQARIDRDVHNTQIQYLLLRKKGKLGQVVTKTTEPSSIEVPKCVQVEVEVENHQSTLLEIAMLELQEVADIEDGAQELQTTDEWVECVLCTKWRRLPRGMLADTLSLTHWNCMDGEAWRPTGLNCDVPADVEENVSYIHAKRYHLTTKWSNKLTTS
jgi:hypothetical protein